MKTNSNLKIFLETIKTFKFNSKFLSVSGIICLILSLSYALLFILTSMKFTSDTTFILDTPLKTFIEYILLTFIFAYIGINLFLFIRKTNHSTNIKYNIEQIKPKVLKYFMFLGLLQLLVFIKDSLGLTAIFKSPDKSYIIFDLISVLSNLLLLIIIFLIFSSVILNKHYSKTSFAIKILSYSYVILFLISVLFRKYDSTVYKDNDVLIQFGISFLLLIFVILPFIFISLSYISKIKANKCEHLDQDEKQHLK